MSEKRKRLIRIRFSHAHDAQTKQPKQNKGRNDRRNYAMPRETKFGTVSLMLVTLNQTNQINY